MRYKSDKDFLKECYDFSQYCLKNRILPENFDETILNVMLWKNKTTNNGFKALFEQMAFSF